MNLRVTVPDADLKQAQREVGWTEMRTRVAFALFAAGKSDSQVACLLGGVTRNAVIGKRARNGIFCGNTVERPKVGLGAVSHAANQRTVRAPGPARMAIPRIKRTDPPPPPIVDKAIPLPQRRQFADLGDDCCRWPVGEPGQPDFFFCGAVVTQNAGARRQPYCRSHAHRAHDPSRAPRRTPDQLVPKLSHAGGVHDFRFRR